MPAFIGEILVMAGSFAVIFGILICCINADTKRDTKRLKLIRSSKCSCKNCKNSRKY